MQTILGATGQIATELARELHRHHTTELRLVSRNPRKVNEADTVLAANLLDAEQTAAAVRGNAPDAFGRTWHLPCDDQRLNYQQFVALAAELFDRPAHYSVIGSLTLTLAGLLKKEVREIQELLPRYRQDNLFDSTAFKQRFPSFKVTTYREGLQFIRQAL